MILVVDHDPEVLERAREILDRERQVFLASNAEQAFEMVSHLGFSVVLVDLDLPGDAYALIQELPPRASGFADHCGQWRG